MIKRYVNALSGAGPSGGYTVIQVAVSTVENQICGESPNLYFISGIYSNIGVGVVIYTNPQLTTRLTGYGYVKNNAGTIYYLDFGNGEVGVPTGNTC
jgi:hypothetical protein